MLSGFIQTFLISMLPFAELRLGIPFGYVEFNLPIWTAVTAGILGTIVSVAIVLSLLPSIVKQLKKFPFFKKFLEKLFHKTRNEHSKKVLLMGELFLMMFVAVPIPGSGGWSGVLIAFVFGLPYWKTMKFVSIGVILAGIIMGILTLGVGKIINIFI
jgi:uncharacterized membrane protein